MRAAMAVACMFLQLFASVSEAILWDGKPLSYRTQSSQDYFIEVEVQSWKAGTVYYSNLPPYLSNRFPMLGTRLCNTGTDKSLYLPRKSRAYLLRIDSWWKVDLSGWELRDTGAFLGGLGNNVRIYTKVLDAGYHQLSDRSAMYLFDEAWNHFFFSWEEVHTYVISITDTGDDVPNCRNLCLNDVNCKSFQICSPVTPLGCGGCYTFSADHQTCNYETSNRHAEKKTLGAGICHEARCSNPDEEHGGSESRNSYLSASVSGNASCQSELQNRTCNNGAWSGWSGSYSHSSCSVKEEDAGGVSGGVSVGVIVLILLLIFCCCVAIGACVYVGYHSPSAVWPFEEKDSRQPDVDKSARAHQPDAKSWWEQPCQPDVGKSDLPVRSKSSILNSRGRANAEAWETATFENSNYCKLYSELEKVQHDYLSGCSVVNDFIDEVGKTHNVAPDVVSNYKIQVCDQFKHACDAKEIALKLWTCAETFEEREFCSHLNAALRGDELHFIQKAVRMCRLLNALVVSGRCRRTLEETVPLGKSTYRGLGMPQEHFAFFTPGKIYRAPMYLSSSFDLDVAKQFMRSNSGYGNLPVLFTIQFDDELGCAHAHYLEDVTVVKGEKEILMPPYSAFTVVSADFDPNGMSKVTIKAFHDNLLDCLKNAPLAPWH